MLSLEYHKEIVRSDALAVIFGLLRTNDYETVVQCLSFLKVLLQTSLAEIPSNQGTNSSSTGASVKVGEIMTKKLLVLVMKTVLRNPEIEYVALLVDIINLVIPDKEQRKLILETILKEEDPATTLIDDEAGPYNYRRMLRNIETNQEVRAIKPLHLKVTR